MNPSLCAFLASMGAHASHMTAYATIQGLSCIVVTVGSICTHAQNIFRVGGVEYVHI
jgi:hypothetical protein